jgi:hypothetical protein
MAVLMALKGPGLRGPGPRGPGDPLHGAHEARSGPPPFVREAHRALLEGLTALFERYRDELAVEPPRAALAVRALVLGSRQPWTDAADRLTGDEIATVLLAGVRRSACSSAC